MDKKYRNGGGSRVKTAQMARDSQFVLYRALAWLTLAAMALTGGLALAADAPQNWLTDFDKARQQAEKEGKPLLAMFSASWCPPCQQMKSQVLPKASVGAELKHWVPVYLNDEDNKELFMQYAAQNIPTFIIMDAQGRELDRFMGYRDEQAFVERLDSWRRNVAKLDELRKKVEADAQNPLLHKQLGDLLAEMGQYGEALESYRAAVKLDPENKLGAAADVAFFEGIELANEDLEKGAARLREIGDKFAASPRAADALFIRAMIALEQQKHPEAVTLLQEYRQKFPQGKFFQAAADYLQQLEQASQQQPAAS